MASIESIDGTRPAEAKKMDFRKVLGAAAAAAILGATVLVMLIFQKPRGPAKLADWYIRDNLIMIATTPGATGPFQAGIDLYNNNNLDEAHLQFKKLLKTDSLQATALLYEGFVSLRTNNFGEALDFFTKLQARSDPHSSPALFYQALALMRRNHGKDADKAKQLLQRISQENLNMKADADELLKRLAE